MDVKFEASIHGCEIKTTEKKDIKPLEVTEKQEDAMQAAISRAKERKAKEYGR